MTTLRGATLLLCIFTFSFGCSDPYAGRKEVTGTVSLKGQPLKEGTIFFAPGDNQGSQANVLITDGKYKVIRKEGLLPGRYVVRISSADKKTTVNEAEAGGPGGSANVTFFDMIPPEWNVESTQVVTVKDGENVFNFDIPNINVPKKGRR